MQYSAEIKEKAKELRKGGMTYIEIAAQLGVVGLSTICRWVNPDVQKNDDVYKLTHKKEARELREKNMADPVKREKERARIRTRRENNRESVREYQKAYRLENKERLDAYALNYKKENAEKLQEKKAVYYLDNKEYFDERNKIYRIENREKILVQRKSKKEMYNEHNRCRRSIMRADEKIDKDQYGVIFGEQEGLCFYCGERMVRTGNHFAENYYNVEHLNPISNGGFHELSNVLYACRKCNFSKGARLVEDWMPEILPKIYSHPRLKYDIEENNKRWLI